MHPVSTTATARSEPLHGVYLGAEQNGIRIAYVYAHGAIVRREPVRVEHMDEECAALTHWLDRKYTSRPALTLLK